MWTRQKTTVNSEIPELRDEYEKLLKETLSEFDPLAEVLPEEDTDLPVQEETATRRAHRRALRAGAQNPGATACRSGRFIQKPRGSFEPRIGA